MNTKRIASSQRFSRSLAIVFACIATSIAASANEQESENAITNLPEQKLVVNIQDLVGRMDFESEYAREELLKTAFRNATERNAWLGEYKFEYNKQLPKNPRGYLEFNVVDWERGHAGFFKCIISASYRNLDGEKLSLGTFHGLRSGIDVIHRWDIGDHFREAAQDAFGQALDAFHELIAST